MRIDPLFEAAQPERVRGVERTAWHTHSLGKTLLIASGVSWARREGGRLEENRPDDVVWFSPNEKHWHGSQGGRLPRDVR